MTPRPPISAHLVLAHPGDTPAAFGRRLAESVAATNATPVLVLLFGRVDAFTTAAPALDCPVLAVEWLPCHAGPLAGAQVFTCGGGMSVRRVRHARRTVAVAFDDGTAHHGLFVARPGAAPLASAPAVQAEHAFATAAATLRELGFDFADLARTWFYVSVQLGREDTRGRSW